MRKLMMLALVGCLAVALIVVTPSMSDVAAQSDGEFGVNISAGEVKEHLMSVGISEEAADITVRLDEEYNEAVKNGASHDELKKLIEKYQEQFDSLRDSSEAPNAEDSHINWLNACCFSGTFNSFEYAAGGSVWASNTK